MCKIEPNEKKGYRIGIMIGNVYANHPQELLRGIYAAAKEYPVTLELFPGTQSSSFYKELTGIADSNDFEYQFNTIYDFALFGDLDALIISYGTLCIFLGDKEKERFFQKYGKIPYVVLEERVESDKTSYIISDNYQGVVQVMEHLITVHGYKKILHISGPLDNTDATERRNGYLDTMKKYHLPVDDKMIIYGDYTEYMTDEVEALLDANPDAEAICVANDSMAISAYKACKRKGLRVGKDIAITGYDDIAVAVSLNPPLTTIEQNGYDMGYIALQKAFALCRGKKEEPVKIQAKMVRRQSCGCREGARRNYLNGAGPDSILRMIPEIVSRMAPEVLLSEQNWKAMENTKAYLNRLITYIIRQMYLSEKEQTVEVHYRNIHKLLDIVSDSTWFDEISIPGVADQINELLLNLAEIEPDTEKKLQFMQLMKKIDEYMLNTYRYYQSTREIDFSKKTWLAPLHMREMMKHSYHEKEVYLKAIWGMQRQNMPSSYIFLFEEPVIYRQEDEWNCPDRLRLAAYQIGEEICSYEPSERPVITREHGFSTLFSENGHTYVAFSLFFEQIQYGMLLCEIGSDDISSTYVVSLQLATGIHFLELNKKDHEMQQRLEEAMEELRAKNQILQSISNSDALTGLLNRRGFVEELLDRMKQHSGEQAYMVFADLDHLKQINDTFGHVEGDFSIRQIGEILQQQIGGESVIARIGGDEFVAAVFLEKGRTQESIKQAVREECCKRNQASEKPYLVECSLGVMEFVCNPSLEVSELLQKADTAMYEAKKGRRISVLKNENEKNRRNEDADSEN